MPRSFKADDLLAQGKLYYGDPCYDARWGSSKEECRRVGGDHLALYVLDHYGIQISADSDYGYQGGAYSSDYVCCCPLDIFNQDAYSTLNMSLQAKLLDSEYWECYSDPFGKARFVRILNGSSETQDLSGTPPVYYCVPSMQYSDIANLVIVRGADPAPFRKCGEWYTVADGTISSLVGRNHIFSDSSNPSDEELATTAKAVAFTWGEVTGFHPNFGRDELRVSSTCEKGTFNQYGTIIYPDYERKQVYADGVRDVFELQGFEQILFWLTDIQYNVSENVLDHYSIQFTKSSEIPVKIDGISQIGRNSGRLYFGPLCDVVEGDHDYDDIVTSVTRYNDSGSTNDSCASIQQAIATAKTEQPEGFTAWAPYSIPSFYEYGVGQSNMSFREVTKWNVIGTYICEDNPYESLYDTTTSVMAGSSILDDWRALSVMGTDYVDFGVQKERRTIDLDNSYWMEIELDGSLALAGKPRYAFRSAAPSKASFSYNKGPWQNAIYDSGAMLTLLYNRYYGASASLGGMGTYNPEGYLMGMDNSLFLLHDIWAKAQVNRPGIHVRGHGRGADSLLSSITMRVMPVYRVDFPAAVAAAGENWPAAGCDYCVDPYDDLEDSLYCEIREDTDTCSEKLQEAMSGTTIDITLPFLFPDFSKHDPQPGGGGGGSRDAFDENCNHCARVAKFLWDYIKKYKDTDDRSYTYTCGAPYTQNEVPALGKSVRVPGGSLRTVNSIAFQYSHDSNLTTTIEVGPVSISNATAGRTTGRGARDESVRGRIISHEYGALYKINIPGVGIIKAWNIDTHPWDTGDRVDVTLYNHPTEI